MIYQIRALFLVPLLCLVAAVNARGQWCQVNVPANLERDYRVIDARPSEVNKVRGKTAFKKKAQIAIVNMNPFMFRYAVKVEQSEIEDRAQLDFLKLLGAPITDLAGIASFRAVKRSGDAETLEAGGDLTRLIARTGGPPPSAPPVPLSTCSVSATPQAELVLNYLASTRDALIAKKTEIDGDFNTLRTQYLPARTTYLSHEDVLYSPSSDASEICTAANTLMASFLANPLPAPAPAADLQRRRTTYPTRETVNALKQKIAELASLISEVKKSATTFKGDTLYSSCQARMYGFDYADSLVSLAEAMEVYHQAAVERANALGNETKAYDFLVKTIKTFGTMDALGNVQPGTGPGTELLQKTFEIAGEYDVSSLDIEVTPEELQPLKPFTDVDDIDRVRAQIASTRQLRGNLQSSSQQVIDGVPVTTIGDIQGDVRADTLHNATIQSASAVRVSQRLRNSAFTEEKSGETEKDAAEEKNVTRANAVIGARRFELSGGMVYSTLDRREFKPVLGFARDANGNIVDAEGNATDKRDLTSIVGFSESSRSRFSPIVVLNTRLTDNPTYNLFFSVGVTAKGSSGGTDVEYLLGPSFNFLNKNAFFTIGAYAGKQQKLAGDLFLGARLSGDDVPVNKEYKWAPAFSFTYRIPIGSSSSR